MATRPSLEPQTPRKHRSLKNLAMVTMADNAAAQDDSANAPTGDDAPAGGAGPETDGSGSPDQATDNPVPAPESTTPEAPAPTPAPAGDEGAVVGDSP